MAPLSRSRHDALLANGALLLFHLLLLLLLLLEGRVSPTSEEDEFDPNGYHPYGKDYLVIY